MKKTEVTKEYLLYSDILANDYGIIIRGAPNVVNIWVKNLDTLINPAFYYLYELDGIEKKLIASKRDLT